METIEFRMNGVEVRLTRQEVIDSVRNQIPRPIHTWAAEIDDRLFPVKQVLSFAVPEIRGQFTSQRARDVLRRLSFRIIDIEHTPDAPHTPGNDVADMGDGAIAVSRVQRRLAVLSLALELSRDRSEITESDVLRVADALDGWVTG